MRGDSNPFRRLPLRYRALLVLLPAHLREQHAGELADDLAVERPGLYRFAGDVLRAACVSHLDVLRQDLRDALRKIRRAPMFAVVAILTLSVGIGGNVAFFTLVDDVLLRPLPLRNAERVVTITEENPTHGLRAFGISPANFRDAVRDTMIFAAAAPHGVRTGTLRVGESRERVSIAAVGGGFFHVIAERPLLGRTLEPDDDVPSPRAIVIGFDLWQRAFGGEPSIVGRDAEIDGARFRVIGVMPKGFAFPSASTDLWQPLGLNAEEWTQRGARYLAGVALLRPGVSVETAAAAVDRVERSLASSFPETNREWTVRLEDARASLVGDVRAPLLLVWGAGALVLLIATANVASLLLTRAVARERELALRVALGARMSRVLRQLATEAAVLSIASAILGVGIASVALAAISPLAAQFVPRMTEVRVDSRVVAYAGLLAVATTTVLTLVALSSVRRDRLWSALGSARAGASRHRRRVQRAIVVGEVALAVFVMIAGGLVVRTLARILSEPLGFEPSGVLTFRIEPPWRLPNHGPSIGDALAAIAVDRARAGAQLSTLEARLRAMPGVTRVGAINRLPLTGNWWTTSIALPETPGSSDADRVHAFVRPVTTDYFGAMGQRVLRGRAFGDTDGPDGAHIVIVDTELARALWGDANPVGREVTLDALGNAPRQRARVVGLVESVRLDRLEGERRPAFYVPFAQSIEGFYLNWGMDVVVRGGMRISDADLRRLVRETVPDAVAFSVSSMDEVIAHSTANRRFQLLVVGCFAALALLLATVGIGGTMLLSVRERREELAVRLALGAGPRRLWWDVQGDGARLAATGIAIGLVGALVGARVFQSVVYEIDPRDPATFSATALLVLLAAGIATLIPAIAAMRINPMEAMRES
jgi:putative ABC transport system permease protein